MSAACANEQHHHERHGSLGSRLFAAWAGPALGLIVATIFLVAIFTYQVEESEFVVKTTFDKIDPEPVQPGLRFRWPYPIQKIYRFDKRYRLLDVKSGATEETYTADGKNIVISLYTLFRVKDPIVFFKSLKNMVNAQSRLNVLFRDAKISVIGRHAFSDFVNTDPKKLKIAAIEKEILAECQASAARDYGVEISHVGVVFLGLPKAITEKVFDRMKAERDKLAKDYLEEGRKLAANIVSEAEKKRDLKLAEANAQAKRIRGEGDAKAAAAYAAFQKDPELAIFLRKLDALKKMLDEKTTLILDDKTPPFDLLGGNYQPLLYGEREKAEKK